MKDQPIRLVLPTGRLHEPVLQLLEDAGLRIPRTTKDYRPPVDDPRFRVKLLKAANIPKMLELGAHDIGFSGRDWVEESEAAIETVLDTGLLPVQVVAAAPRGRNPLTERRDRPLVVASEYERLTQRYMNAQGVAWQFIRTFGATEVYPPEDADMIVDNRASGAALAANGLEVRDVLLDSTALFLAHGPALQRPEVAEAVSDLRLLLASVVEARKRVLLEINVDAGCLQQVLGILPAMKAPTVQPLSDDGAFGVKAAVLTSQVPGLIPRLKRAGATDILETSLRRVTP